ncbi:ABC transporter ATP-binding protein [Georgenia deserti]|uniref:ABC transporter ATP-binding protein n=1 Tax=Georgenia deserti TaxID=2093781 RepID=A0ABW4L8U2_9MICO
MTTADGPTADEAPPGSTTTGDDAAPLRTPPADGVPAARLRASVAGRAVDVDIAVPAGQVVALLGANGAGKSTVLGLAAGTVRPTAGTVEIGGRTVAGPRWVPPHGRHVALLAQDPLLFPHLDVTANVAFGLRATGLRRGEAARRAREMLEIVGAAHLVDRRPGELSGGQAQRVALARALAPDPAVVLLDEPLSALDVAAAAETRQVLRRVLRDAGRSTVLVTHDLLDVLAVADSAVVLEGGRVTEQGPALEVLERPRSAFAANLAGVNLVTGTLGADGESVRTAGGLVLHGLPDPGCVPGTPAAATFSPRAVSVHAEPPGGSPRTVARARVVSLERQAELVRVRAATEGGLELAADITPSAVAALDLAPGIDVALVVKAAEVRISPA